jgi:Glycosyl transferase family 2
MTPPLSVTILYNKANPFGLQDDVAVIERLLKQELIGQTILKPRLVDIREPLIHSDIQIHLEVPIYGAIPWAHTNIILVNPEQWSYSYDSYLHAFDLILFRDPISADRFRSDLQAKGIATDHIYSIPWCGSPITDVRSIDPGAGFVCFIAGSTNKYEYLKKLLPHWKDNDPPLTIYTTRNDIAEGLRATGPSLRITIICNELDTHTQQKIMMNYLGHLLVSAGEGFGYGASHSEQMGAFALMNELPVFTSTYSDSPGVAWLTNAYHHSETMRYSFASPSSTVREELDRAFSQFREIDVLSLKTSRRARAASRFQQLCDTFRPLLQLIQSIVLSRRPSKGVVHCPPLLLIDDCPPITIITPTYNRKKLIDIAFHNLLATDYPRNKIEWIVIEDNEKTPHMASDKIVQFQVQVPDLRIKYIPIEGRMTIGEKRNCAIREASNDIILFMDDDDHYPSTSFRRRVAWLTKGVKRGKTEHTIACCTTLALYDLQRGVSAVNVPPFDIAFAQRISEATLTFRKSAWEERPFPLVSISEGEAWLQGREDQVIEIPPQQIIVAFTHGNNQTSRRIPPSDQPPSCFWGFPKEYLVFIHGLAGVEVEEDKKKR